MITSVSFSDVTGRLDSSNIAEIRRKLKEILGRLFEVFRITYSSLSKLLYLAVLLVVMDAMTYMRKYYSDDSFDNMFIDRNLKKFWETENRTILTPLRNWELKAGYQISKSVKLSKAEAKQMVIASIPTMFATMLVALICFADVSFTTVRYYCINILFLNDLIYAV